MAKRKKKKNEVLEAMMPTLILGGIGAGTAVVGGAIEPLAPAGFGHPISQAGGTIGRFARVAAPIGLGGYLIKKVRKFDKKKKKSFW